MKHPTLRPLACATLLLSLVVAAGCGTANYEQRMEARLVGLRHLAKFRPLNDVPSELLPGTTEVTIRLPIKPITFGTQMTLETRDPNDTIKLMDSRRVQPPGLPLPGFLSSYEQLIPDVRGNKLPYTIYIAAEKVAPSAEGAEKGDPLEETLLKQLKAALPGLSEETLQKLQWQDVACSSPYPTSPPKPGVPPVFSTIPWRSLEVECEQEFFAILDGGVRDYVKEPGILKLFLYEYKEQEATRYFVLIGWRVPKKLLDQLKIPPEETIDHLMNLVGGTIKVNPPPVQ